MGIFQGNQLGLDLHRFLNPGGFCLALAKDFPYPSFLALVARGERIKCSSRIEATVETEREMFSLEARSSVK